MGRTRVVGTGVVAERLAGFVPKRILSADGRSCEYSSMDFIGTVSVSNTNAIGDVLYVQQLSPLLMPSTRTAYEAAQWERYHVREWSMLMGPLKGTNTDGQVIGLIDPDPYDQWPNTPLNMNKAAAQYGAMPDNVWQNFEASLPVVPGVADFYTNATVSSDARLSQAGTFRVVYAGGVNFPTGVTTINLFNVYQLVDFKFYQPELTLPTTAQSVGKAKTQTPTATNVLNGATVSSSIPVSITTSGVNIDTSSLGSNNIVAEVILQAKNVADVAATFGVDLGVPTGVLDSLTQAIRLPERSFAQGEAVSQVLLPGDQSWTLSPQTFGLTNANLQEALLNLYPVPGSITTLADALPLTRQRALRTPVSDHDTATAAWTSSLPGASFTPSTIWMFRALTDQYAGSINPPIIVSGFDPYWQNSVSTQSSQPQVDMIWTAANTGDLVVIEQMIAKTQTSAGNLSPVDWPVDGPLGCTLVYQNYVSVYNSSSTSTGEFLRSYYQVTDSTSQCTIHIPDTQTAVNSNTLYCTLDVTVYPNGPWSAAMIKNLQLLTSHPVDSGEKSSRRKSLKATSAVVEQTPGHESAISHNLVRLSIDDSDSSDDEGSFCTVEPEKPARKVSVVARGRQ